eukprot:2050538-Prymnesium_polylepis.2
MRVRTLSPKCEHTVRDGTRFRPYLASICVSDSGASTYEREDNSASFLLVIYALGCAVYRDSTVLVRCSFRSFTSRPGTRPESLPSAARLSQLYLAWVVGRGDHFRSFSPTFGAKVLSQL